MIAKFFAEPAGQLKNYDPHRAMIKEYRSLQKAGQFVNIAKPIAVRADYNCVLITEYIKGNNLLWYFKHQEQLYDVLGSLALTLRRLHDNTQASYDKEKEFANYHQLLDQHRLDDIKRERFNQLLGKWWHSQLIDSDRGCMIHRDVSPLNYIIKEGVPYLLDMESCWHHANSIRDVGTLCAELKNYFQLHCGSGIRAEPYIGHFVWLYSRSEEDFQRIVRTLPFFMSIGLLRTARLHRHTEHYDYLLKEAIECLRAIE